MPSCRHLMGPRILLVAMVPALTLLVATWWVFYSSSDDAPFPQPTAVAAPLKAELGRRRVTAAASVSSTSSAVGASTTTVLTTPAMSLPATRQPVATLIVVYPGDVTGSRTPTCGDRCARIAAARATWASADVLDATRTAVLFAPDPFDLARDHGVPQEAWGHHEIVALASVIQRRPATTTTEEIKKQASSTSEKISPIRSPWLGNKTKFDYYRDVLTLARRLYPNVDFLFQVHDHTLVLPQNLRRFTRQVFATRSSSSLSGSPPIAYWGTMLQQQPHTNRSRFLSEPAGTLLTATAWDWLLRRWAVADGLTANQPRCVPPPTSWHSNAPNHAIAECLIDAGHAMLPALELGSGKDLMNVYSVVRTALRDFDDWFVRYKRNLDGGEMSPDGHGGAARRLSAVFGNETAVSRACCATFPISFHYTDADEVRFVYGVIAGAVIADVERNGETRASNGGRSRSVHDIIREWPGHVGGYSRRPTPSDTDAVAYLRYGIALDI